MQVTDKHNERIAKMIFGSDASVRVSRTFNSKLLSCYKIGLHKLVNIRKQ